MQPDEIDLLCDHYIAKTADFQCPPALRPHLREALHAILRPLAPQPEEKRVEWHDELLLRWCEWSGGHLSDQNLLGILHDIVTENLLIGRPLPQRNEP